MTKVIKGITNVITLIVLVSSCWTIKFTTSIFNDVNENAKFNGFEPMPNLIQSEQKTTQTKDAEAGAKADADNAAEMDREEGEADSKTEVADSAEAAPFKSKRGVNLSKSKRVNHLCESKGDNLCKSPRGVNPLKSKAGDNLHQESLVDNQRRLDQHSLVNEQRGDNLSKSKGVNLLESQRSRSMRRAERSKEGRSEQKQERQKRAEIRNLQLFRKEGASNYFVPQQQEMRVFSSMRRGGRGKIRKPGQSPQVCMEDYQVFRKGGASNYFGSSTLLDSVRLHVA
jgi:hypothetical protein